MCLWLCSACTGTGFTHILTTFSGFRQKAESAPSIDSGSVDAYVPGMGKQLDGCRVAPLARPPGPT